MIETSLIDRFLRVCVGVLAGGLIVACCAIPFCRVPEAKTVTPYGHGAHVKLSSVELYTKVLEGLEDGQTATCVGYGKFIITLPSEEVYLIESASLGNSWSSVRIR